MVGGRSPGPNRFGGVRHTFQPVSAASPTYLSLPIALGLRPVPRPILDRLQVLLVAVAQVDRWLDCAIRQGVFLHSCCLARGVLTIDTITTIGDFFSIRVIHVVIESLPRVLTNGTLTNATRRKSPPRFGVAEDLLALDLDLQQVPRRRTAQSVSLASRAAFLIVCDSALPPLDFR